jgi:hypothetical protein
MRVQHTGGSPFQPLRWGLLVYEVFRLVILIRIMSGELLGNGFPSLIFGAANTLFILMALFMVVDFYRYSVYASLYTAGKIVTVITLISCGFFWQERIIRAIILEDAAPLVERLATLTLGDLLTAAGGIFLALRRPDHAEARGRDADTAVGTGTVADSEGAELPASKTSGESGEDL